MEDKILKFATAVVVVLTVAVCIGLPFFPQIHTWAVESREERLAEQEYAENQTEMKDLEIVAADTSEQVHGGQLQLKLPEGINGSDIQFTNDYVTQTIKISIPGTDRSYFENGPITGSSNHIATLSYSSKGEDGVIEIVMDHVYELKTEYDSAYYYFDFLTPQEVYDKVVVIDAGHGGRAPGANKQGVNEKEIDLDIVLQLKKILDEDDHNIGVYYTRTDDSNPTFDQRVQLANKSDADLFISVHNNSTNSGRMSSANGTAVMYNESDESELGSKRLAQICLEEVTGQLQSRNRGLVEGDSIYIIRTSKVPVALIEVGFMTNQQDLDLLRSEDYQKEAALGIYHAILRAFEEGY